MTATAERFWSKARRGSRTQCWPWLAARLANGYGRFSVAGDVVGAHRFAYELARGPIPAGLFVCHRCDNRRCVNPGHLFVGTARDNAADMAQKGRSTAGRRRPGTGPAGERNGRCRLPDRRVAELRAARDRGVALRALARRFGISKSQAHNIATGAQRR